MELKKPIEVIYCLSDSDNMNRLNDGCLIFVRAHHTYRINDIRRIPCIDQKRMENSFVSVELNCSAGLICLVWISERLSWEL